MDVSLRNSLMLLLWAGAGATARAGAPGTGEVLGWLPPRTESVLVAHGPFKLQLKPLDSKEEPSLEECLGSGVTDLTGIDSDFLREHLNGRTVHLAVFGARRFRPPEGEGMGTYEGCHVLVFREALDARGDTLAKALSAGGAPEVRLSGRPVFRFEEKTGRERRSFFYSIPQPDVLLCATDEAYLEEVLERQARKAGPEFVRGRFLGWERLDKDRFWGIRQRNKWSFQAPEEDWVTRFEFTYNPGRANGLTFRYASPAQEALDRISRGNKTVVRRLRNDLLEIRPSESENKEFFLRIIFGLGFQVIV